MKTWKTLSLLALSIASLSASAVETRSTAEVIASAQEADWRTVEQDNLLYMTLPQGRVVFELAGDFAPEHVKQIKFLAQKHFWDDLHVYRVQDNYVVQFGDAYFEDELKKRPLPEGTKALPVEFERRDAGLEGVKYFPDRDGWASRVGYWKGFAVANEGEKIWLSHCYGALGAGRDMAPDSSNGAELYVVIGQSPRYLDRNITLVGRVIYGMEHLSALPRGGGDNGGYAGFYQDPAQYVPIKNIRLGSELEASEQLPLQVMKTENDVFADMVETRRNRRNDWFVSQMNYTDVCNIAVPVRLADKK